jgi:hypothetical protein
MTVRKQEILYGLNAVTNDICHISEIDDVSFTQHGSEHAYEFSFKYVRENAIITFNSPKRDAIVNVSFKRSQMRMGTDAIMFYCFCRQSVIASDALI